jgi:3'(2'), 5'-bisphosphate nucleotidase
VDPLDGTKEFVKRNGEFTINIALIEGRYPVFGLIYAPCMDLMYYGGWQEARRVEGSGPPRPIQVSRPTDAITVVESRSHPSAEFVNAGIHLTHQRRNKIDPPVCLVSNRFRFLLCP